VARSIRVGRGLHHLERQGIDIFPRFLHRTALCCRGRSKSQNQNAGNERFDHWGSPPEIAAGLNRNRSAFQVPEVRDTVAQFLALTFECPLSEESFALRDGKQKVSISFRSTPRSEPVGSVGLRKASPDK
jgi:hypothetical protein